MTAPTINGARYPQPVDALLPQARKLAAELGEIPSRNRLMREYRIGAPKAEEIRDRLFEVANEVARSEAYRDMLTEEAAARRTREANEPARMTEEELRRRLAEQFGYTPPDARPSDPVEPAGQTRVSDPGTDPDDTPDTGAPAADPWDYAAPIGPVPAPVEPTRTPTPNPGTTPAVEAAPEPAAVEPDTEASAVGHPGTPSPRTPRRPVAVWPVILLALPAFVAIWGGWVGLGGLTGFGKVNLLPGIVDPGKWATIDSAITLPIGVETYAAYALYVWLSGRVPGRARAFAKWSALGSLLVGALGQVAYHLLVAAKVTAAPWQITTAVACLPVAVLGMGAALAHLVREDAQ